jgi:hypothetical protein
MDVYGRIILKFSRVNGVCVCVDWIHLKDSVQRRDLMNIVTDL